MKAMCLASRKDRCSSIRRPIRNRAPVLTTRGRILSGGITTKARPVGLVISQQHQSVRISQEIAHAINRRFFTFVDGRKKGVATPKTSEFIDVVIHPRYHDNIARYMQILRNVAIDESPNTQQARLLFLEQQLSDPLTAPPPRCGWKRSATIRRSKS